MKKKIGLFEVSLLVLSVFAFAYLVSESREHFDFGGTGEEAFITWARENFLNLIDGGLVSAQEALWTCLENVNGSACQEYPASTCEENCNVACFQGRRDEYSECRLGTCFDPGEGVCAANTPRATCEGSGGEWTDQEEGVPAQCNPGCCLIGDGAQYITERACNVLSERLGIESEWDHAANELVCLARAQQQEEGACVLEEIVGEGFNCQFGTKAQCLSLGGEFHNDLLCSAEELNTVCQRQDHTSCIEGEDEVYWIDSCGNRENIYDSNKARSWNDGKILAKEDSCSLSSGNNPFGNQRRCGNCNYLGGSICGAPGARDKQPVDGDFVCRDLSCVDEWGDERKHGESWCAFDGRIGVDNEDSANLERAVDVPGSRHHRRVCFNGEVRTEPCADARGEVCVENRDERAEFSAAACRINTWQVCYEANTEQASLDACEEHTDCTLHRVDIDDFEFDVCTAKYPPGFDLAAEKGGEVASGICELASRSCTYIEVKKLSGWKCEVNCGCRDGVFTEAMNNLCMSLGDCGAHVNVVGDYTDDGYSINHRGQPLSSGYISGLKKYAEPKKNQFVEPLTTDEIAALFGIPRATFDNDAEFAEFLGKLGLGAVGVAVLYTVAIEGVSLASLFAGGALGAEGATALTIGQNANIIGAGFTNALLGAAAGAAIGFLVGKAFGLEGDAMTILVITGALTGAIAAPQIFVQGAVFGKALIAFLFWVVIVVIIVAVILKLLGIGKTRERVVEFSCMPWQPPTGGANCELCNEDPLGCSIYQCNSLGQTCEFINEGTSDELCVDVSPNDANPPIIDVNQAAIGESLAYVGAQKDVGTRIENTLAGDGCVQEYAPIAFGVSLNEPGQCKIEAVHTDSYETMTTFFGGSNLYKVDHEMVFAAPTLSELGVPGIDPERRGEYDLFVRCQDASGNTNIREYNIQLCVSPANDLTPPIITEFIPESPGYAGLGVETKFVQFFTNEPAECKWELTDRAYADMQGPVLCDNGIEQVTEKGWSCSVDLPVTGEETQPYYFRCEDQPWLAEGEDESGRNVNAESVVYEIVKTTEPLVIDFVDPNNETIVAAGEPVAVDVEVHTAGGVDGKAFCEFSFTGEDFIGFFETGGIIHKQRFSSLFEGSYDLSLMCTDRAENVATGNAAFDIVVDNAGPIITRVYDSSGTLTVVTDESSQCAFDFNSCSFNFEEGTPMSGTGLVHTTGFDEGINYYIKCEDTFGNIGGCLVVREGV